MTSKALAWAGDSLRRALVVRLVLALTAIGLVGAGLASALVDRYANLAYDRALADDLTTLANQLELEDGAVHLDLPPVARRWLLANEGEQVLYRVIEVATGKIIEANGDLGPWRLDRRTLETPELRTVQLGSTPFRLASLEHRLPRTSFVVLVQIAETMGQRQRIVREILVGALLVFGAMIAAAVAVVWTGSRSVMRPLELLEAQAALRSSTDLRPLDPTLAPLEVRSLVEAMNRLMERLSQSIESQGRFIANAAHQLRTPLAGLRLQAQLGREEATSPKVQARLDEIDRSAGRAAHLVEQLLTLARAEAGGALAFGGPVDLVQEALTVVERHLPLAVSRGIDLGYQGQEASAVVTGNATLLREMLSNLIDNAVRHGPANGTVTLAVERRDGAVSAEVMDDGDGLPTSVLKDLFTRFNRSDSGATQGAGLGLAIVKEIADQHAAQIRHRRLEPRGHSVVVEFPPARA